MDRYNDEKHNVINKLIFTVLAIAIVLAIALAVQYCIDNFAVKQSYDNKYITFVSERGSRAALQVCVSDNS